MESKFHAKFMYCPSLINVNYISYCKCMNLNFNCEVSPKRRMCDLFYGWWRNHGQFSSGVRISTYLSCDTNMCPLAYLLSSVGQNLDCRHAHICIIISLLINPSHSKHVEYCIEKKCNWQYMVNLWIWTLAVFKSIHVISPPKNTVPRLKIWVPKSTVFCSATLEITYCKFANTACSKIGDAYSFGFPEEQHFCQREQWTYSFRWI